MIVFWLLVFVLTCAGVAALVIPLLRRRAPVAVDERAMRLAVYRDRKHEIEAERSAGRLNDDEAGKAIDELAGDAAVSLPSTPSNAVGGHHLGMAAALMIAVPILAVVIYLALGVPSIITIDPDLARGRAGPADVAQAIESLTRRVREQPDDGQAWAMLAQARRVQGDFDGATQAFAEASKLQPQNARLLAEFAETIAASRDGDFSGRAEQLLEQALAVSPREPKALALMGAAQYRLGRPERALVYLRTLLAAMDPQTEQARQIQAVADRIAGEVAPGGAAKGATPPVAQGAAVAPPSSTTGATGAAATTGTPPAGADSSVGISGRLSLTDELRGKLAPGATLFVSARLPEGPRMPLAAIRLSADKLPIDYVLSDAQAMSPDRRLSQAGEVVIEARISRSGNAIRQSGDLLGASAVVRPGATNVDIRIDQVVP